MSQATMDRRPNFGRRSGNRTIRMMIVDDSVTARAVMMSSESPSSAAVVAGLEPLDKPSLQRDP